MKRLRPKQQESVERLVSTVHKTVDLLDQLSARIVESEPAAVCRTFAARLSRALRAIQLAFPALGLPATRGSRFTVKNQVDARKNLRIAGLPPESESTEREGE